MSYSRVEPSDIEAQQPVAASPASSSTSGMPIEANPLHVSDDSEKYLDEAEEIVRQGFIRKVFGLLGIQLLLTSGVIAFFALYDPVTQYVGVHEKKGGHPWVFILAMIISFVCIIALACCPHQARTYPNNYGFLGIFTLAESVLLGVVCASYTAQSILIAGAVTALISLGLMIYAWKSKTDFTGAGPYLFMALWCLILYGFILGLFPVLRQSAQTAYSLVGVVIFSFYLIYDVQLIIGGKHNRFRFGVDEHVFATLNVYLDIVNLFIRILQIFGDRR